MPSASDVSAVVCSWNAVNSIQECLHSLRNNNIGEIIVVDADSSDGTREIALRYADILLIDPKEGLAMARNIGISSVKNEFVLNVGVDNIIPHGSIDKMLDYMITNGFAGVSAVTLMNDISKSYFSWAMNHYKQARYYPGERLVIGTPTLFKTQTLIDNKYDHKMSWSDDGDLCLRLSKKGYRFAIAPVIVYELGSENIHSIKTRWDGYGKSDWETYSKYSSEWSLIRKIQSILYPLKNELILPFFRIKFGISFGVLPFLSLITFLRYSSWIKYSISTLIKVER